MRKITLGMLFVFLTLLLVGTAFADNINIENARVFAEDGFVRAIVDVETSKSMSGVKTQMFILGGDVIYSDGPYKVRDDRLTNSNLAVVEEPEEMVVMISVGKGKDRKTVYRFIEFD